LYRITDKYNCQRQSLKRDNIFEKERNDNVRNCKEMGVIQAPGAETMCKEPDRWCGSP